MFAVNAGGSSMARCLSTAACHRATAKLISGTEVASSIRRRLAEEVAAKGIQPGLAVVQVGGRHDSSIYVNMKLKAAKEIGISASHIRLPKNVTEEDILEEIDRLNEDPRIHGIIIQLPLDADDKTIDSHAVTDSIDPGKDVDGLCTMNEGRIATGDLESGFHPCTPAGCLELIKQTGEPITGASAVVIGRSKLVGTPMAELLKWNHATVTVCHSKTKNIPELVSRADILVVAMGKAEFVPGEWIKEGAVVIDCGINSIPDSSKKSGYRLVGDVHFESASHRAGHITPVPGGVGPMTVCFLMNNTVQSAKRFHDKESSW